MDSVKKHWRIIAFGVACAASLGVCVWQVMASSDVTARMTGIQQLNNNIRGLATGAANKDTIEIKRKELEAKKVQFDSAEAVALAVQKNNAFYEEADDQGSVVPSPRQTVSPNVLPAPATPGAAIDFQAAYRDAFNKLPAKLRAEDQPSQDEINQAQGKLDLQKKSPAGPVGGGPWSIPEIFGQQLASRDDSERTRLEVLREFARSVASYDRAKSIWMYLTKNAIVQHPMVDLSTKPTDMQIWQAQMSLWIQQDIAAALYRCNARRAAELRSAKREADIWVAHMPVKHLKELAISNRLGGGGGSHVPQEGFPPSPTKVVNNNEMFVVPMHMLLVVEEAALPEVLQELASVGFYTPTSLSFRDVPPNPLQVGYIYGDDPLVDVKIEFEGYFFRKVFDPWIPKELHSVLATPQTGEDVLSGGGGPPVRGGGTLRGRG